MIKKFSDFLNEAGPSGNKNILKWYGENFPIADVKVGQKVVYKGMPLWVHDRSDVHLLLSKKKRNENPTEQDFIKVNQAMFNQSAVLKDEFDDNKDV